MTKFAYSIVFVRDMAKSISFYRDLLGLSLRSESPAWTQFATEGCSLSLHLAAEDFGGRIPVSVMSFGQP